MFGKQKLNFLACGKSRDAVLNPLWPALKDHESDMAVMMSSRGDGLRVSVTITLLVAGSPMTFQGGDTEGQGRTDKSEVVGLG